MLTCTLCTISYTVIYFTIALSLGIYGMTLSELIHAYIPYHITGICFITALFSQNSGMVLGKNGFFAIKTVGILYVLYHITGFCFISGNLRKMTVSDLIHAYIVWSH